MTEINRLEFGDNAGLCLPYWFVPYWPQNVLAEGPECPERQIPPAAAERIAHKQADRAALVALYHATNGDQWTNNIRWLSGQPLGKWHGVTTDDQGRVTALDLVAYTANYTSMISNNLTGELPPELGNLSELVSLEIYDSNLTGPIPPELGNLSKLRGLDLSGNALTGPIPPGIGQPEQPPRLGSQRKQFDRPHSRRVGQSGGTGQPASARQ